MLPVSQKWLFFVACLILSCLTTQAAAAGDKADAKKKPNIVIILADDKC